MTIVRFPLHSFSKLHSSYQRHAAAGSAVKREKRDRRFHFYEIYYAAYPPPGRNFAYTDVLFYVTGKDVCCGNFFGRALWRNFLGQSPDWYKLILLVFLVVNPLIFSREPVYRRMAAGRGSLSSPWQWL